MAQVTLVQLVDDLDGTSSQDISTVQFGLDGVNYEIDLTDTNADKLRQVFEDYVGAARRTGGRVKRGTRTNGGGAASGSGEAGQIRLWANENGFELSNRGRIPAHVVEAYKQAQAENAPKPRKATTKRRAPKKG
jgi:hypothetical protein